VATNILYITEPGTIAHKVDERLVLKRSSRAVGDVPLLNLKQVVVIGRGIEVTTEAMLALVERDIDLCFFTRSLKFRARLCGEATRYGELRFKQARFVDDPARQLALAKLMIQGKLHNQRRLLVKTSSETRPAARQIEKIIENVPSARHLDGLRGFEGQGAAVYFEAYRGLLKGARELGFVRRDYYPAPDPVNALLSFGYSLLTREALAAIYLVGLEPHLGFFHAIDYGRPSLALDLIEEFRPAVVDALVLEVVNLGLIGAEDFEGAAAEPGAKPATRLKAAARNRYLELYERKMSERIPYGQKGEQSSYRRAVELQTRQLARVLLGETDRYYPVVLN
jgi:CRISPR-associated protein Cas1